MEFTARIEMSEDGWYVGQVEEVPAAISQGKTIDELKANLLDALEMIFEVNRTKLSEEDREKKVIRERLILAS